MSQFQTLVVASLLLISCNASSQYPQQISTVRAISRMPPIYESEPDAELVGRFVNHTSSGCALSFARSAVRGLLWSGGCQGGRMQGSGTVLGVDYEKQPVFFYEGQIERGLRTQGSIYEFERKNGQFVGSRTPVVNSALQSSVEMPFLDMPRAFLLALDDWQRQLSGENFLASLGATWAPGYQAAATSGASSSSASGRPAGQLSPPSGRASLIALTPPGNARPRNECVKFEVLDAPIARAKANSPTLVDSDSFGTSRDGRRLNQKHLVAYSTCSEPLIITALSCSQTHMKDAGSNGGDSWSRGEFTGIGFTGQGVANVRNDVRLWVSKDLVLKQAYRNSD